ncbi:Mu transposase C-terminal domain-containing protein [Thiohalobacter thiocyanaticus]|nr:Mu transposase C-terminal domain-containing protein [Thiohalobacter thiocyanaticus]
MALAYLEPQRLIQLDGETYELHRQVSDREWQLEKKSNGQYVTYPIDELHRKYVSCELTFVGIEGIRLSSSSTVDRQLAALDILEYGGEEDKEVKLTKSDKKRLAKNRRRVADAKVRYAYVKAVEAARLDCLTEATLAPVIKTVWESLCKPNVQPNWVTVYRWYKRYLDGGRDIRTLLSKDCMKGNRKRRYSNEFIDFIRVAVKNRYLQREKNTITDTLNLAIDLVRKENRLRPSGTQLPLPTKSLVKSVIEEIPAFDRSVARNGREAALREFRSVLHEIVTSRPLERVELDHSKFDLMVLDDNTYMPLGRPTVAVALDVFTRSILGLYIGFEPPSYHTVAQCLKHAILPKTDLRSKYPDIINEWEPHGVMDMIVLDNALENHSANLEALGGSLGISFLYVPRKKSWFKPYVERVIGTLNRDTAHGIPGTTFSNILEKGDYDAAKNAVVTLSTFKEMVHKWVADVYHQEEHDSLLKRPATMWKEHAADYPVPLPADPNDFDALIGGVRYRSVTHKGVEMSGLFYNSKELAEMRLKWGSTFRATVRYNPCDLGHIYVIDPETNQPLRVDALRKDYSTGLSEWQHKLCKKYAREYLDRADIEAVAQAKEEIRELAQRDLMGKRVKTRSTAYRFVKTESGSDDSPVSNNHESESVNDFAIPETGQEEHVPSGATHKSQTAGKSVEISHQSSDTPRKLNIIVDDS